MRDGQGLGLMVKVGQIIEAGILPRPKLLLKRPSLTMNALLLNWKVVCPAFASK